MNKHLIKFRAWDGRQMQVGFNISAYNGDIFSGAGYEKDWPLMQFIGLQDKNKKDIYEGDIGQIKTQGGRIENFVVEWGIHRRWMESGWEVDIPSFCFKISGFPSFPIVNNYMNGHDLDIIEIIGNIYQNPELIPDAEIMK